jgi:hypothetical protein
VKPEDVGDNALVHEIESSGFMRQIAATH